MIPLHCHLQEEWIGYLWCCDVMHGINTECLQCGVSEVFECISHESHIEYIVLLVVFTPCLDIECLPQFHHVIIFILGHHFTLHIINALLARGNKGVFKESYDLMRVIGHGFLPCQQIDVFVTPLFAPFFAVLSELSLVMFVVIQIISECLSHNGLERTTDQFQQVLKLNTMVFDLHFLALSGWNDFQISIVVFHRCNEFHDECEVIMRSIVEVHWQSIVLLVEWEL